MWRLLQFWAETWTWWVPVCHELPGRGSARGCFIFFCGFPVNLKTSYSKYMTHLHRYWQTATCKPAHRRLEWSSSRWMWIRPSQRCSFLKGCQGGLKVLRWELEAFFWQILKGLEKDAANGIILALNWALQQSTPWAIHTTRIFLPVYRITRQFTTYLEHDGKCNNEGQEKAPRYDLKKSLE